MRKWKKWLLAAGAVFVILVSIGAILGEGKKKPPATPTVRVAHHPRVVAHHASKPAAPVKHAAPRDRHELAEACSGFEGVEASACRVAYEVCSVNARAKVEAYYHETGPRLETITHRYVTSLYSLEPGESPADNPAWVGAESGCEGALFHEYEVLYYPH